MHVVWAQTAMVVLSSRGPGLYPRALGSARDHRARRSNDIYLTEELLSDEERDVRDRVRRFCDEEVRPVINGYWERAEFPFALLPKLAELGVCGGTIQGYGCPGLTPLGSGLVAMELARGDGSVSTFHGVHVRPHDEHDRPPGLGGAEAAPAAAAGAPGRRSAPSRSPSRSTAPTRWPSRPGYAASATAT